MSPKSSAGRRIRRRCIETMSHRKHQVGHRSRRACRALAPLSIPFRSTIRPASLRVRGAWSVYPTAVQVDADGQVRSVRAFVAARVFGLRSIVQLAPFHDSARVVPEPMLETAPTATHAEIEVHDTLARVLSSPGRSGLEAIAQAAPRR